MADLFIRGSCVCGGGVCEQCHCDCHDMDDYSLLRILSSVKHIVPNLQVGVLAGVNRNEVFRWLRVNVRGDYYRCLKEFVLQSPPDKQVVSCDIVPPDIARFVGERLADSPTSIMERNHSGTGGAARNARPKRIESIDSILADFGMSGLRFEKRKSSKKDKRSIGKPSKKSSKTSNMHSKSRRAACSVS